MLSDQENELLTKIAPGTPAGELLRRYWHPISGASELTEENPTKFVRILGEDLVLFKDKKGRVGLLADRCSHRGASLSCGKERIRVEGRPYFDGDNSKFVDRRPADRLLDQIFRK